MRVLTLGTFDLFHAGHVKFLRQCAQLGELTVGVNTDRFVRSYKRQPVIPHDERREIVEALEFVHNAFLNDGPGSEEIRARKPNILAIGPDWYARDYPAQIGMHPDELFDLNITLAFVPPARVPGLSATEIRERIR